MQLPQIIQESTGYRPNLPVSRTDDQISRIRRKILKISVFKIILTDFSEKTVKYLTYFCGFYTIFMVEKSRSQRKIGGLPDIDFLRLASL